MARLTVGQKAARVTAFLVGVRKRRVASALARCGFAKEDLAEGWARLTALTEGRLDVVVSDGDPKLVEALDAWENEWFPVANASLRARFPEAHKFLFNNLTQTEGLEVITSVGTFLTRVEKLSLPENEGGLGRQGAAARKLLVKRGITEEVVREARDLLTQLGHIESTDEPDGLDEEEDAQREQALWDWYLEWSEIARTKIKNRRLLRSLGFLKPDGSPVDDEADDEAAPPIGTPAPSGGGGPTPVA